MRLEDFADDDFCRTCGKDLPLTKMYGFRAFCDWRCRNRWFSQLRSEARAEARAGLTCGHCGKPLTHLSRSDAKWCGPRCRNAAYEERKRGHQKA